MVCKVKPLIGAGLGLANFGALSHDVMGGTPRGATCFQCGYITLYNYITYFGILCPIIVGHIFSSNHVLTMFSTTPCTGPTAAFRGEVRPGQGLCGEIHRSQDRPGSYRRAGAGRRTDEGTGNRMEGEDGVRMVRGCRLRPPEGHASFFTAIGNTHYEDQSYMAWRGL